MAEEETYLSIGCSIIYSTARALKIAPESQSGQEFWVPKSLLSHGSDWIDDLKQGDSVELRITEWFCENEGIEG